MIVMASVFRLNLDIYCTCINFC